MTGKTAMTGMTGMAVKTGPTRQGAGAGARSQRLRWVWSLFAGAMTAVGGLLLLLDGAAPQPVMASMTTTSAIARGTRAVQPESVLPTGANLDRSRWRSIVIHHSGLPAGSGATIERHQQSAGLSGLGYHFVIGNGHGMSDGEVQVGYRWTSQLAGAHVVQRPRSEAQGARRVALGPNGLADLNEHSIGICLIGNGDRTPFTPRQIREVISLVRALQRELGIPATEVYLHRDLADVSSPGERFPAAEFESRLFP